jgi:hypothetical protein
MQSHYPAQFVRDMGCTEAEWRTWLPRALGDRAWRELAAVDAATAASPPALTADIGCGHLHLTWQTLPPRRLGLAVLPRLQVSFAFVQVAEDERQAFMKRFDLYTQRGGG